MRHRLLYSALVIGYVLLMLSGVYTAIVRSLSGFYMGVILFHLGFGVLFILPLVAYAIVYVRGVPRQGAEFKPFLSGGAALLCLIVCAATGVYIIVFGAFGEHRWVLRPHAVSGTGTLVFYLLRRWARGRLVFRLSSPAKAAGIVTIIALAAFVLLALRHVAQAQRSNSASSTNSVRIGVAVGDPKSPFFASSAHTKDSGFLPFQMFSDETNQYCATAGCHPDIHQQWLSSAHRFSSFNNPFYRRTTLYQEERGVPRLITRFCGSCHDPAMQFTGLMKDGATIDPKFASTETSASRLVLSSLQKNGNQVDRETEAARMGVTCLACHSIVEVKSPRGNCDYVIEEPKHYPWAFSKNRLLHRLNPLLIRVKPDMHQETFLKPLHKMSEFCSVCHKVGIPQAANHYRWQRAFTEYDSWQLGGISGQSARSFYNPKQFKICRDCHMPTVPSGDAGQRGGRVHNHSFPGAHTALPAWRGDDEHLQKVTKFLRNGWMTVNIFGIRYLGDTQYATHNTPFATLSTPLFAPLRDGDVVARGETVRVEVVVRNREVGHQFTGGTRDAHEPWLEFQVTGSKGRTLFHSGFVDEKGEVDLRAHFYRSSLIDRAGNLVNKRNAAIDWIATVYGRQIDVGQCDVVHYRFTIPEDVGDELTLTAKLHHRKWRLWYHKWVFQGKPVQDGGKPQVDALVDERKWVFDEDKPLPPLPIVTMAEAKVKIKVLPAGASLTETGKRRSTEDRDRFYDYGVGLVVQRDFRGAEATFRRVIEIDPNFVEGYIALGRVFIEEGNLTGALEQLSKAWQLNPGYFKTAYFLGLVYKGLGHYDKALHLLRSVQEKFPRDRLVCNQIGRVLFLKRDFKQATAEFEKTLRIDPEDVFAHYNLMLCYRGLGETEKEKQHAELYLTYKPDETIRRLTGPYRQAHSADNIEAQLIHDHQ